MRRGHGWLIYLTAALCAGAAPAQVTETPVHAAQPATATRTSASKLPPGLAAVVAATLAPREYHLTPAARGWQAANPAQGVATTFSPQGLQIAPTAGGPALGLALSRLGRSGHLTSPDPAQLVAAGARIEYRRGPNLTEWYINDARGVEQGFTLDSPPPGNRAQPLVVELSPTGGFRPTLDPAASSIRFESPTGTTLHYGGLFAFDTAGQALPAQLALGSNHGTVTLTVDDARRPTRSPSTR